MQPRDLLASSLQQLMASAPPWDPVFTPEEAASRLRISRRSLYRLIASGDLASFKLRRGRRIRHSAIESYLEGLDGNGQTAQRAGSPPKYEVQTD